MSQSEEQPGHDQTTDPLADPRVYAIVQRAYEILNLAETTYIAWVRQMASIATAVLTALIALQDNFAPDRLGAPLILLWLCWIALALTVAMCALILHGESSMYHQAATQKVKTLQTHDPFPGGEPHEPAKKARALLPLTLATTLVLLCAFAIVNSVPKSDEQSDARKTSAPSGVNHHSSSRSP